VSPNIRCVKDVATLAAEMLDELEARRRSVAVLLPDLAVVSFLFPSSGDGGDGDVRSRLHARLGFPASEARSDFWRGRRGEVLGAAVRQAVVRQYEQVVEAAECRLGWMDGASLVRIPRWVLGSEGDPRWSVRIQLYASHYVMASLRSGELVDVRTRLRSTADAGSVVEEVSRLPAIHGIPSLGAVVFSGEDAEACAALSRERSIGDAAAVEEGEETQLQSALAELLHRRGAA
jgi:hypothetical protein